MKKRRVYISGPMTGIQELNRPAFMKAKRFYEMYPPEMNEEFEVVIPHDLNVGVTDWKLCMENDIRELMTCDEVFMLEGWRHSPGARIESMIAKRLGLIIVGALE